MRPRAGQSFCSEDTGYTLLFSLFHRHMRTHGSSTPTRHSNHCHTTSYSLILLLGIEIKKKVIDAFSSQIVMILLVGTWNFTIVICK